MTILYPGYQFLHNKVVWTCRYTVPLSADYEPVWECSSDEGDIRSFGVSQIAVWPQVVAGGRTSATPADDGVHGTRGRYTKGCRCDACKAANADYMKGWRYRNG